MEQTTEAIKLANEEAKESRTILEDLKNQIIAVNKAIFPELIEQVTKMREARMAVVGEMHQSLNMLQDVRKFFIDSSYEMEMERLERFVAVCREIKKLKDEGTLEAICDAAIRLAIKEESRGEK